MTHYRSTLQAFALAALACAPIVPAQTEPPVPPAAAKSTTGREDLRQAKLQVAKVKGLRGGSRTEALDRAVDAYRQVLTRHPADQSTCAQAWFEIGELQRRKASLAEAEKSYAQAAALDADRFAARSLLQQAHMQRRLDRPAEALASYRKLAVLDPNTGRGHTARLWIARSLEEQGDVKGAIDAYRSALDLTKSASRIIELCNGLAKALLNQGDMSAAEEALARAESAVPAGGGEEMVRLRKAVDRMSARKALQRAKDKASKAHEDARKLEEEKRERKEERRER